MVACRRRRVVYRLSLFAGFTSPTEFGSDCGGGGGVFCSALKSLRTVDRAPHCETETFRLLSFRLLFSSGEGQVQVGKNSDKDSTRHDLPQLLEYFRGQSGVQVVSFSRKTPEGVRP